MNFISLKLKVSNLEERIRKNEAGAVAKERQLTLLLKERELWHLHGKWLRRGVELSDQTYSKLVDKIQQLAADNAKLASTARQETMLQYTLQKNIQALENTLKQCKIQLNFAHALLTTHGLTCLDTGQTLAEISTDEKVSSSESE